MAASAETIKNILIGAGRLELSNVRLREDLIVDEIHIDAADVAVELPVADEEPVVSSGEARVRARMSEVNLNRFVQGRLPDQSPVRQLEIALLSGRARISGKAQAGIASLPFSIEAAPIVENGVRVTLDCRNASVGIGLPQAVVEIIQHRINEALRLDVSSLEIPIWIDEIRCEPGRLTAIGRARLVWPPASVHVPVSPVTAPLHRASTGFKISSEPLFGAAPAQPNQRAIEPADDATLSPPSA